MAGGQKYFICNTWECPGPGGMVRVGELKATLLVFTGMSVFLTLPISDLCKPRSDTAIHYGRLEKPESSSPFHAKQETELHWAIPMFLFKLMYINWSLCYLYVCFRQKQYNLSVYLFIIYSTCLI